MKNLLLITFCVLFLFGCKGNANKPAEVIAGDEGKVKPAVTEASADSNQLPEVKETIKPVELPPSVNLDVPFLSQAPLANWDNLHNEACEEASVLQVVLFLDGSGMSKNTADQKLVKMVNWQEDNFGGHFDLPAAKVKEFIEMYFHKNAEIFYDISFDDIKKQLADGHPVIIPAAGRTLGNPNFKTLGPVYHMLIIRGYDENKKQFITNDVGTRKGENYRYSYDTIMNSIHDMPKWEQNKNLLDADPDMIFAGRRAMIVIKN